LKQVETAKYSASISRNLSRPEISVTSRFLSRISFLPRPAPFSISRKSNTALVCFSIIAGEHKIEITRDRLLHEYNLGLDEIPTVKLLRIAKDLGLKSRLLNLQWDGLLNLKKAYPAIAKLRNGRHMILVGITHGHGDLQQETMIACYDPLAGSGGGHLRLTREEFEAVWSGEIYLFKRTYKLSDETQPFSLRWFIPEILRQKLTFVDIGLAVLFINAIALVTPIFFRSSSIRCW